MIARCLSRASFRLSASRETAQGSFFFILALGLMARAALRNTEPRPADLASKACVCRARSTSRPRQSTCPLMAAHRSAVRSLAHCAMMSAPSEHSFSTVSMCPLDAAQCRGVARSCARSCTMPPSSQITWQAKGWPARAAQWRGVPPVSVSCALRSASSFASSRISATLPACAAKCTAVAPLEARTFTSTPSSTISRTTSRLPLEQAQCRGVQPEKSSSSSSRPRKMSREITLSCPTAAARCSAVRPRGSR
mmetsp:Transcript_25829/g.56068  ORF Transcript_25829/g.56068 Transcript_25829/m.56068 type:complete len:251 (+) Transcript_25829:185-937(+)